MEHEWKSSTETSDQQNLPVLEFRPSPELLHELPPQTFNLEQMEAGQVVGLVIALDFTLDYGRGKDETLKESDELSISVLTGLLQQDLASLLARDIVKACETYTALATHSDPGVRGLVSDVMDSLLRFQSENYGVRQPVIDLWMALLRDENSNVQEGARTSMSRAVHSDWLDEPTARYLDERLPGEWQREDWWEE